MDPVIEIGLLIGTLVVLGVIGSLLFIFVFSRSARLRKELRRTPRAAIKDLIEGHTARVVGTVVATQPLASPMSKRACAYYEAIVEVSEHGGNRRSWRPVKTDSERVPFAVDDGTGMVLVNPAEAELLVASHEQHPRESSDGFGRILERNAGPMRYREAIIAIGEPVTVLGYVDRDPAAGGGVRMVGSATRTLVISDDADP